jgi:hypothetical protein
MIVISSLSQARQMIKETRESCLLIADPDLVGMLGVGYFVEITRQLQNDSQHLDLLLAIPCHHFPSLVFAALEHTLAGIFFDDDHPLWPKIVSIIEQRGMFVKPMRELIPR